MGKREGEQWTMRETRFQTEPRKAVVRRVQVHEPRRVKNLNDFFQFWSWRP